MKRSLTVIALSAAAAASAGGARSAPADLDAAFAAILKLEDRRADGRELERYLGPDQPAELRERAAFAAGRIGAPAATPYLLVDLLRDRSPRLRRIAVFALGEMDDVKAALLLAGTLADEDAGVRALSAEALGKLKDPASVALLAQRLDDRDEEVAGMALLALWKIDLRDHRPRIVERASAIAGQSSGELRRRAVYFLMRAVMGKPDDAAAEKALRLRTRDGDALLRSWVARGLGAAPSPEATEDLLKLAKDSDWRVRVNAFNGLRARPVEELRRGARWKIYADGLSDRMPAVSISALASMESFEGGEAGEAIRKALKDPRPRWREVAALALAARDKERSRDAIAPLARDTVWSVRARVAEAFSLAGMHDQAIALAKDNDARVRAAVIAALADDKVPAAEAALAAALRDDDPYVRAAALGALPHAKQTPAAALEAARTGYDRARGDEANDARLAALEAMAKTGGEGARAGLEAGLADSDYLVRRKAAQLLRDTFQADRFADVKEAAVRLGDADYAEVVKRAGRRVTATIQIDAGEIRLDLFPADAPLTVDNFIRLARAGSFDGLAFHRVVPNFVIQDGDPRGDGNGGPPWQIRCEINQRRYGAGMLGMALSGKDTGGSQYFITHSPQPHLDGGYTIFGQVTSGQDLVDRMVQGDAIRRVVVSVAS